MKSVLDWDETAFYALNIWKIEYKNPNFYLESLLLNIVDFV